MVFRNRELIEILKDIDMGSDIAEQDSLLNEVKIETSVFSDLLRDRVDLIPGTKGSGKSALYRIFVEFLPEALLKSKKVVIAHGVNRSGDSVFHAYKDAFEKLSEDEFVDFWCIYFISLAHEQFIKNDVFKDYIINYVDEIDIFRKACQRANIPEIVGKKSLKEILSWCLNAVGELGRYIHPDIKYKPASGEIQATLFGGTANKESEKLTKPASILPVYIIDIRTALENILEKSDLNIWLMIDRLDEIFPRRSDLERRALRGLLKTTRLFDSPRIRIKVFLRDDIFSNIVRTEEGFTALTHIISRKSDTLKWEENQMLDLILKRLTVSKILKNKLEIDSDKLEASVAYRKEIFYKIFPETVYKGARQSSTMTWIFKHSQDGNGVVTPRDVIFLITKAKQRQQDLLMSDPDGESNYIIDSQSITYAHEELSKHKRTTYLEAEFPHLWLHIKKLIGGKTQYTTDSIKKIFGKKWEIISNDLISIGVLSKTKDTYIIPFLYRKSLEVTQGKL